jgi:ElaB/YqjD/DUF883 family membrane-anchored ribosome-binding protein
MALPKQVQAQLDEVEALEKTLSAREKDPKTDKKAEKGTEKTETEGEKPKVEAEKAAEKPEAKPTDPKPEVVPEDFEQRYRTLRGKYDAEVPRLHQQVNTLREEIEALTKKVSAPAPKEPEKPKEKVSYVTDADRQEFGDELIDVQRRVAREVAEEFQEQLQAQAAIIEELKGQVTSTGSQIGQMGFSQRLIHLVPDFDKIDNDKRWIAWLNEYDPMLRGPRRDRAKDAFDAGDAEAVADYVKLFKATLPTDTPNPDTERSERQAELDKQVAPNRTANSAVTPSVGKESKVYSAREVEAVWTKIRTLNSRGLIDDAAKLEAEITTAYLEGRVRQ